MSRSFFNKVIPSQDACRDASPNPSKGTPSLISVLEIDIVTPFVKLFYDTRFVSTRQSFL